MQPTQLDAYLTRIGLGHLPKADAAGLTALQRAHRLAIPFENLDIRLGRGISLEPDQVFAKLVTHKRGGYCFEHNALFMAALTALGFTVRPLLARVWLVAAANIVPPRTHTLSLVTIGDEHWIADAGFGGSYAPPMKILPDHPVAAPDGTMHRLMADTLHGWMLERQAEDGVWRKQFSFTLGQVEASDLAMSNHWTATSPESRFVRSCIVSAVLPHGAASLQDLRYTRTSQTDRVESDITSIRMLQMRLSLVFGIDLEREEVEALGLF